MAIAADFRGRPWYLSRVGYLPWHWPRTAADYCGTCCVWKSAEARRYSRGNYRGPPRTSVVIAALPWQWSRTAAGIVTAVSKRFYDSLPQNQRFSSTNVSRLLDARKDTLEKSVSIYFPVCKGLSIDDVGVSRDTAFQEIRPGAGCETGDFVKETSGGLP